MFAALINGYGDLAEWLVLLAAILFVVAGFLTWTYAPTGTTTAPARPDPTRGTLIAFGLAALALAWLIL
ncbi:MAG TPA: hypothetical protein VJM75_13855 [Acidimicrobiales bacterium]|nr:hypothetical protein [Acidimicrobiales bacterium]